MVSDDDDEEGMVTNQNQDMKSSKELANPIKLENLLKRRTVYGDITQNASETQLNRLLVSLIKFLMQATFNKHNFSETYLTYIIVWHQIILIFSGNA